MFKSCYPNSELEGSPGDAPVSGDNPMQGMSCSDVAYTVGGAKRIYNGILSYFAMRQDKLFIPVTTPPTVEGSASAESAANARALSDWLDGVLSNEDAVTV